MKQTSPEYDVALSFAGENRDYVEQVARLLQAAGVKVFYDKFETAKLWGDNLADHLGEVYGKRSRFVVIFISKYYPLKAWPKHERQSAQARAITENKIVLLPARFDDTEIEGMPSSTAYVDLRRMTPTDFARLIQEKLKE
ncbi:MAG: TIR domain-containing protein [Chthoniobacterales bacterium]|nr:TIR domain-containing protein [Chthoniobacterales bacterium]